MPYDDDRRRDRAREARRRAAWSARSSPPTTASRARSCSAPAPYHGRLLLVNRDSAKESTGHGSPLPHLVHGGPGRAGGGEEMGGMRGVLHYMQRTAFRARRRRSSHVTGRWIDRARRARSPDPSVPQVLRGAGDRRHRRSPAARTVTVEDIEHFARHQRRHLLRPHGRGRGQANRSSRSASRTATSWCRPPRDCSSIRRRVRCSPTTASRVCAS